jgi:hypothetical protein
MHGTLHALAILLLYGCISALLPAQEPKRSPEVKPSDCAGCHTAKSPLPKDHVATAGLTLTDCRGCHEKGGDNSLVGKISLSHIHQLTGVTCGKCHEDVKNPQPVGFKRCLTCHDMDKVSLATANVKPTNPHASPHFGKNADCSLCHHMHEKSEIYCAQCHDFAFKVP